MAQDPPEQADNTIAMLGHAYSLLGFQIVDGVVGAGFPQKPSHSAVFAQIRPEGSRLTELARGANCHPRRWANWSTSWRNWGTSSDGQIRPTAARS